MLTYNTRNTLKDNKKKKKNWSRALPQGLFILPKYLLWRFVSWSYSITCLLDVLKTAWTWWTLKNKSHPFEQISFSFPRHCEKSWFLLPQFISHVELYKKPFRELRTLCLQAQLVVTAEVKRCFRSQRAVQPPSASTKCCLCFGYFQTSCTCRLLRSWAFPPWPSNCLSLYHLHG